MAKRSPRGSQEKSVTVSDGTTDENVSHADSGQTRTLELDHLNREILLAYPEDFKVAEDRLLRFRMTVNPDTEEVSLVLPVKFTLRDMRLAMDVVRRQE